MYPFSTLFYDKGWRWVMILSNWMRINAKKTFTFVPFFFSCHPALFHFAHFLHVSTVILMFSYKLTFLNLTYFGQNNKMMRDWFLINYICNWIYKKGIWLHKAIGLNMDKRNTQNMFQGNRHRNVPHKRLLIFDL